MQMSMTNRSNTRASVKARAGSMNDTDTNLVIEGLRGWIEELGIDIWARCYLEERACVELGLDGAVELNSLVEPCELCGRAEMRGISSA